MTENKHIYQAMFLLDNQEVRKSYAEARDWVRTTLEKHGAEVSVLRLWAEQELAYPIGGKRRATYLLGWISATGQAVNEAKRELDLLGPVFRVLFLRAEEIPQEELEIGIQELADGELVIPEDVPEVEEEEVFAEDLASSAEEEPAEDKSSEETPKEDSEEAAPAEEDVKTDEDPTPQEETSNV